MPARHIPLGTGGKSREVVVSPRRDRCRGRVPSAGLRWCKEGNLLCLTCGPRGIGSPTVIPRSSVPGVGWPGSHRRLLPVSSAPAGTGHGLPRYGAEEAGGRAGPRRGTPPKTSQLSRVPTSASRHWILVVGPADHLGAGAALPPPCPAVSLSLPCGFLHCFSPSAILCLSFPTSVATNTHMCYLLPPSHPEAYLYRARLLPSLPESTGGAGRGWQCP